MKSEGLKTLLAAPFPAHHIHWRPGNTTRDKSKAIALAYLDSRDVQERLDDVCGIAGWQCAYPWSESGRLVCEIGINVDGEWIWKADGAGDGNFEAEKAAFSNAFKRCAVKWGIGRYLYDLPNKFVPLDNNRFSDETQRELTERLAAWQEKYFSKREAE